MKNNPVVTLFAVLSFTSNFASSVDNNRTSLEVYPRDVVIEINEITNITYRSRVPLLSDVYLHFNHSDYYDVNDEVILLESTGSGTLQVAGRKPISHSFIEIVNCTTDVSLQCPISTDDAFVRLSVIKSHFINDLTTIVGWMYFSAWSLSFYPQIYLNFKRKSVTGLNFDFLLLNVIGFSAYSVYNLLMYYDPNVQAEYEREHPRSPIPVLLNDVIFALHALAACIVTALQCFLYETNFKRGHQRVSTTCTILSSLLVLYAVLSTLAALLNYLNALQLIMCFSYVKLVVTLSKYVPQMYFNFQRKSTVGWSIGNVLLDFTGGSMDILQMVLQCMNNNDWKAFIGNPVKFGLGLVSIFFDIIFITQHYILYKGVDVVHAQYEGVQNPQAPQTLSPTDQDTIVSSSEPILEVVPI